MCQIINDKLYDHTLYLSQKRYRVFILCVYLSFVPFTIRPVRSLKKLRSQCESVFIYLLKENLLLKNISLIFSAIYHVIPFVSVPQGVK